MWFCASITVVLIAMGFGFLIMNPILFGFDTGVSLDRYFVISKHFMLDGELPHIHNQNYIQSEDEIKAYRNHCLRIMTFARHFLPNELMHQGGSGPQSGAVIMNTLGMAVAYHKVGLWMDMDYDDDGSNDVNETSSDNSKEDENEKQKEKEPQQPIHILAPTGFDYRNASIVTMEHYTRKVGILGDREIRMARAIIDEQFRLTEFGNSASLNNNDKETEILNALINAVRKANWADCTYGIIRFGLPVPLFEAAYKTLAPQGFHQMLTKRILRNCQKNLIQAPLDILKMLFT